MSHVSCCGYGRDKTNTIDLIKHQGLTNNYPVPGIDVIPENDYVTVVTPTEKIQQKTLMILCMMMGLICWIDIAEVDETANIFIVANSIISEGNDMDDKEEEGEDYY